MNYEKDHLRTTSDTTSGHTLYVTLYLLNAMYNEYWSMSKFRKPPAIKTKLDLLHDTTPAWIALLHLCKAIAYDRIAFLCALVHKGIHVIG